MDATGLAKALQDNEKTIRRLQAEQYQILADVESRGALALFGYSTTIAVTQELLRVSRKDATAMVARATALNPIMMGSSITPASAPLVAEAAVEGVLGASHIDAITTVLKALPDNTTPEDLESAEKILVDLARETGTRGILRAGREILARLDPDGHQPTEKELAEPHRELHLHQRRNGWFFFKGMLDPETSAQLQALLSPLAAPKPSTEHGADPRDAGQRNGDAFADIIDLALHSNELPTEAGELPHIVVTLDYETLKSGIGQACLDLVGDISASQARRIACDANIIPVGLGSQGEPLDVGRKHRLVTTPQRRALVIRDQGCAFPGCERPPKNCQAHHVVHWADGGNTDLDNLVLLCGQHHRLMHHSDWEIHIGIDRLPVFIPPRWLDPDQKPRHNRPIRT